MQLAGFLKKEEPSEDFLSWLVALVSRQAVGGIIFGCTELHLLHRPLARYPGGSLGKRIVDPLLIAARDLKLMLKC